MKSIPEFVLFKLMSNFDCTSPSVPLGQAVLAELEKDLPKDKAVELYARYSAVIEKKVVDEYNEWGGDYNKLRFQISQTDSDTFIKGNRSYERTLLKFQKILGGVSPTEFEVMGAVILKYLGCKGVFRTPASHDQGIDAFGSLPFPKQIRDFTVENDMCVVLAQVKHYNEGIVGSSDFRELIGSTELAVHRIFSTVDERYKDLNLLPYSPKLLLFLTSGSVSKGFARMAKRAGVVTISLFDLHAKERKIFKGNSSTSRKLKNFLASKADEFEVAV
jgi:hypothetical protein